MQQNIAYINASKINYTVEIMNQAVLSSNFWVIWAKRKFKDDKKRKKYQTEGNLHQV